MVWITLERSDSAGQLNEVFAGLADSASSGADCKISHRRARNKRPILHHHSRWGTIRGQKRHFGKVNFPRMLARDKIDHNVTLQLSGVNSQEVCTGHLARSG